MMNLIGIKRLSGTSKKTGKPVNGAVLYVAYGDKDVEGAACDSFYLPNDRIPQNLPVGCSLDVRYNREGRVVSVEVVHEP